MTPPKGKVIVDLGPARRATNFSAYVGRSINVSCGYQVILQVTMHYNLQAYGQIPSVPEGRPAQISVTVTKLSALPVCLILLLSTATGTSRTDCSLPPPGSGMLVDPLTTQE